jgi:hypothetical protein
MSTVYPPHYSSADVATARLIWGWMNTYGYTFKALARMIGGSSGSVCQVLNGVYANNPERYLQRIKEAVLQARKPAAPKGGLGQVDLPIDCRMLQLLDKHSSANPMSVGDLIARIGGDEPTAWRALEALIAKREVMSATVIRKGLSSLVVYPMGRIPSTRPGPKERARGPAIVITPRSIYGGNQA